MKHKRAARDKFAAEILRTVGLPRIIAAVGLVLHEQNRIEQPTRDQIADYVGELDIRGLKLLRKVAVRLEECSEPMQ
jgi:hypothetical protein